MTVQRVRGISFDTYGDPTGDTTETTIPGAFTAPRVSNDNDDRGRTGVIVGLSLFLPYGTDVIHTDQWRIDGELYDTDGEPGRWKHPKTGWEAGIEVALTRAKG